MEPARLAPPATGVPEARFADFVRLCVAGGDAAAETITTYVREARYFRSHLAAKGLELAALTPMDLRAWVRELVSWGYKPTTIATKLAAVRRLLDAAVEYGVLARNPADAIRGPRDRRDETAAAERALDADTAKRLYATIDGRDGLAIRDRAILALTIGQGLRTIELHRLDVAHVDLARRELRVTGKGHDRTIFLRADVAERLRVLLALRPNAAIDDPLLISCARNELGGHRLSTRGVRFVLDRAFAIAGLVPRDRHALTGAPLRRAARGKQAARRAGVILPSAHGLRATFISLARRGGAEPERIADDVGHRDRRQTLKYLARDRRRDASSALHVPLDFG